MARVKLTIDHKGFAELLKGAALGNATADAAEAIATNTRERLERQGASQGRGRKRQSPPVVDVQRATTDREHDTVMIHGAGALAYQTRDGILTAATGAAGLKFRGVK